MCLQVYKQLTMLAVKVTNLPELLDHCMPTEVATALSMLHMQLDESLKAEAGYCIDDPAQSHLTVLTGEGGGTNRRSAAELQQGVSSTTRQVFARRARRAPVAAGIKGEADQVARALRIARALLGAVGAHIKLPDGVKLQLAASVHMLPAQVSAGRPLARLVPARAPSGVRSRRGVVPGHVFD